MGHFSNNLVRYISLCGDDLASNISMHCGYKNYLSTTKTRNTDSGGVDSDPNPVPTLKKKPDPAAKNIMDPILNFFFSRYNSQ